MRALTGSNWASVAEVGMNRKPWKQWLVWVRTVGRTNSHLSRRRWRCELTSRQLMFSWLKQGRWNDECALTSSKGRCFFYCENQYNKTSWLHSMSPGAKFHEIYMISFGFISTKRTGEISPVLQPIFIHPPTFLNEWWLVIVTLLLGESMLCAILVVTVP